MRILIDSSILIEYEKQTQTELLDYLLASNHMLYFNAIIASEYLYILLGILAQKSPMSVAESGRVAETLDRYEGPLFLDALQYLDTPAEAVSVAFNLMKKHNLLPNDALILASCKLQNIAVLASHDSDFAQACRGENVALIGSLDDFSQLTGS